jgi:hypothetical protein
MKKENISWNIRKLLENIKIIDFPEFQREPTVWSLEKKQRLIDSIIRGFDIASMYFYRKQDNGKYSYDCIDGRQRINAILSFVGMNKTEGSNNNFPLIMNNEIYTDTEQFEEIIQKIGNKKFQDLKKEDQDKILDYEINIVEMSDIAPEEELNLLFLRLNLGQILNAGEKLHAMIGYMRDYIFNKVGQHPFFTELSIPYRRYAREQVAAQIALNYFIRKATGKFHRSRYTDLLEFFKEKSKFSSEDERLTTEIIQILDKLCSQFKGKLTYIRNRAIAVSVFFFVQELVDQGKETEVSNFVEFLVAFLKTLRWQVPQEVKMHSAYYYLLDFQTYVTQAAGEEYAIRSRHEFLCNSFDFFKKENAIKGDKKYYKDTGKSADAARAQISL